MRVSQAIRSSSPDEDTHIINIIVLVEVLFVVIIIVVLFIEGLVLKGLTSEVVNGAGDNLSTSRVRSVSAMSISGENAPFLSDPRQSGNPLRVSPQSPRAPHLRCRHFRWPLLWEEQED